MNVGMVGLGKLGLPVAAAMASRGITVYGVDPSVTAPPEDCSREAGLAEVLRDAGGRLKFATLEEAVASCDVLFVAVQTPHEERFDGAHPLPDDRADFGYTYLVGAVWQIAREATRQNRTLTLAVISTVLPGTMQREIVPLLGYRLGLVYAPSFIAMGTVIRDFLNPEFVLLGGDNGQVRAVFQHVYGLDEHPRVVDTTVENAELIKVAYNTMIGLKIAFANTLMEVCHKTGCDVDEVTGALKLARRRLISGAYLDGGMGDGGSCHPRDNIALSWLARELGLSFDLFGAAMQAREQQAQWLCDLLVNAAGGLPVAILGTEFKAGLPGGARDEAGSPAILCEHLLADRGEDPVMIRRNGLLPAEPHAFLIGCKHPEYSELRFPEGSVVVDPHRYIPDQDGVTVVRVGEAPVFARVA